MELHATTGDRAGNAEKSSRVALWDNARFLLIVLVVIGHLISTVRTENEFGFALYAYIYLFHMPAMILLAGLFARPEAQPKAIRSTIQLLCTWVIWEIIWALLRALVDRELPGTGFLVNPSWTLWFLVSLATMRILLPYIARLRRPLVFAIVVSLGAGMLPSLGTEFSFMRTLTFMPFFVAGWLIRERGWLEGRWFTRPSRAARPAATAVLVAVGAWVALQPPDFWRIDRWLTWRDDNLRKLDRAPVGDWVPTEWSLVTVSGTLLTALLLSVAALMTLALLLLTPRRTSVITAWGSRTLYVYLLHGPIVWALRGVGVVDALNELGWIGIPLLMLLGLGLAILLSMAWVPRVFRPLIQPRIDWLLARERS